jgi:hypothetical protein
MDLKSSLLNAVWDSDDIAIYALMDYFLENDNEKDVILLRTAIQEGIQFLPNKTILFKDVDQSNKFGNRLVEIFTNDIVFKCGNSHNNYNDRSFGIRGYSVVDMLGKTLKIIEVSREKDEIHFYTTNDEHYVMYHAQDCCESVVIEDIIGNLDDLVGSPLLMCEEQTKDDNDHWGAGMWTFYKFATIKGYVTLRWYGDSNGYYSISVDFTKVEHI